MDAERFVLGSILLDGARFIDIAHVVVRDDFSLERHDRIFQRMMELNERGEKIDRVTVANELQRWGELESVGGLTYLVSLDDGLPHIANIDSYLAIIRKKACLRRIAHVTQHGLNRALVGEEEPGAIVSSLAAQIEAISAGIDIHGSGLIDKLPPVAADIEEVRYLLKPELPEGAVIALTGDSGSGKSTLATAWARDVIASGHPVLILDRENMRSLIADRMRRLGLADSPLLRWAGGWSSEVPEPDSPQVKKWVRSCELKPLIVVDSLIAFLGGNENDASDMRRFTDRLRVLANMGATVIVIHHDGKAESARDFRGSSDFKGSIDQAFHVTNVSSDMRLDKLRLRCFKSRPGFVGELVYHYADGRVLKDESRAAPAKTVTAQLRSLLRENPGVKVSEFESRAFAKGIARSRAREFLEDGVREGTIDRETGARNAKMHSWTGGEIE